MQLQEKRFLEPIHVSWHLTAIATGVLVGTATVLTVDPYDFIGLSWLLAAIALIVAAMLKRRLVMLLMAFLGGALIGLWRGSELAIEMNRYEVYFGEEVVVNGRVADDTTYSSDGDQRLRLDNISINGESLPGYVWASTSSEATIKRGDLVDIRGRLNNGFGNMSASMFRAEPVNIQRPVPGDTARRLRDRFIAFVGEALPDKEAGLGSSFLFGQSQLLSRDFAQQLRLLGLTHLVVASGFHLTIIIREFRRRLTEHSKYLATFVSFVIIASFLLLTGFSTSMTRASLVATFSLLAWYWGRVIHPVVLLTVVAAITVLMDPTSIWADAGWFLSFAAFGGIVILAPLLHDYFWGNSQPGTLRRITVDTIAATITTFPIIAYTFGQYSPLALVSNLLVLPAVPVAMAFTAAGGIAAIFSATAGQIIGLPALILLRYVSEIANWLAASPFAYGEIELSFTSVGVIYLIILLIIVFLWRKTGLDFRHTNPID